MLTLNSNILKIGNKWILPVQSGGVVPPEPGEIVSYVLRVWNSHDRRINFQKLVLTDQDPTTVDYSVLPVGNRPTQSPVAYVPPLITSVKAYTLGSNTSYDMSSQIQEYANGGVMDTGDTGTIRTAWEDKRYEGYVDMEFTWPYSFPIISSSSLTVWNGFAFQLYGILDNGHYVELAQYTITGQTGPQSFTTDTSTVYDVTTSGQGTVTLWPSAGNEGDKLSIHWEPTTGNTLTGFTVQGTGAVESGGVLTVGTEDVSITPSFGSYDNYDRYEVEISSAVTGRSYIIANMYEPTPVSGTVTSQYGTSNLTSTAMAYITNNHYSGVTVSPNEGMKFGNDFDETVRLTFGSNIGPYIKFDSQKADNEHYATTSDCVNAQLYGWKNGIKYPLGLTKIIPDNIHQSFKVSTARNTNIPVYSVTTTATNGSLSASPAGGVAGTTCTLTATADSGYAFDSYTLVSGTGASISGNILTIGTSDVTVRANFVEESSGYDHYMLSVQYTSNTSNNGTLFLRNGLVNGSASPNALSCTQSDSWGNTSSSPYVSIGSTSWSNTDLGGSTYCNKVTFELDMSSDPSSMSFMLYDVSGHTCSARFYGIDSLGTEHTIHEWTGLADRDTFTYTN